MAEEVAAAAAAAAATQQPVAVQVIGNAFVQQYYHILHHSPELVFRFYQDRSKVGRPEEDGTMSITTTMQGINEKIVSLNYGELSAEIKSVDTQESFHGGVQVLVTGCLIGKDSIRYFSQVFFLAPQDRGYFVLNDIFRYIENVNHQDGNQGSVNDVVVPVTAEQNPTPPAPVQENDISEQSTPTGEVNGGEVFNPPETVDVQVVEEEVPVADVGNEVQDETKMVVESNIKIEEVPKKSYASIVMDLKGSAVAFSSPAPAPRKSLPKSQEQANLLPASETELVHQSDAVDNGNNQEGEADGYSIYIKGLPMNATVSLLENEFKRFGPIRNGGIQVRSNRQQGFCFGFVEFEVPSAVQKALEASPITIGGGRQIVVEEKRSTNSRGNNRGKFPPGRGSGSRNDGARGGRGNYGGGRAGYNRGDFIGRNEFNNRGGYRGGSFNRGGDGYQRSDSNGGRVNRAGGGGMGSGAAKNMTPRVSATA